MAAINHSVSNYISWIIQIW